MLEIKRYNEREALLVVLDELATYYLKPLDCEKYYVILERVYYSNGHIVKHYYSDIFTKILDIQSDDSFNRDLGKLRTNIELLHSNYQKYRADHPKNSDLTDCLKKLYDHISLEVAKLDYNESTFKRNIEKSITNNIEQQLSKIVEKNKNDISLYANGIEKKFNENEKNYITILGIFASFVVAFVGGLSFSSSILEGISQVSIYRLIIVILLLGLFILSICFLLFWFIARVINKNDVTGLNRIYLISLRIIVILLIICALFWLFDGIKWKNRLNKMIDKKFNSIVTLTDGAIDHYVGDVATISIIE